MSCACLLACTHADSQTFIKPSLIHRIRKQNTLFLMDGFINSRALQPLNSALESFTKVCNLLIGDIWIFLDGKDRRNLGQPGPLEAQSWTLLLVTSVRSGRGEGCPAFAPWSRMRKAPCLAILEANAGTAWKVTAHSRPLQPFAGG